MTARAAARDRPARRPPLLLTLAGVGAVALATLPLAYLVLRTVGGGERVWRVLGADRIATLVLQTGTLVVVVCGLAVLAGVPLAWLVTRTDLPARRLFAVGAALPLVIPSYVAALVLLAAFGPRGLLQRLLEGPFGVERVPDMYGLGGASLALALSTYPFVYLLVAAAFRDVDPSLEEAARSLGRSPFGAFWHVSLPAVRPSIAAGVLLVALYTLSDFGAVSLMQYDSLTRAVFLHYRALFDRTPAAALALVLVALTAVVLALEARARGHGRFHRTSPGAARLRAPVSLGRWRWPAVVFCSGVLAVALALPVGVLSYWAARAVTLGDLEWSWRPVVSSLLVSLLAAAAAATASLPVAVLAVRYPRRWTIVLERLAYASSALPGIVIALSLVFFAANYASPIYQTLLLLVAAYVVRFLPQAVAGSHSALLRVDPRLEEAARGLGRSPASVFAHVTAPLVAPGVAAGAALVFLSTMKELPVTLLLRPIGFETLATEIWKYTSVASYSRAALPALVLIAVSTPFVYWLALRGGREVGGVE